MNTHTGNFHTYIQTKWFFSSNLFYLDFFQLVAAAIHDAVQCYRLIYEEKKKARDDRCLRRVRDQSQESRQFYEHEPVPLTSDVPQTGQHFLNLCWMLKIMAILT